MAAKKTGGRARRRGGARHTVAPNQGLAQAVSRVAAELDAADAQYALVGGLAVSARAEPRTTRDVDLAVSVPDDTAAEQLLFSLQRKGYSVFSLVEQERVGRLATARLLGAKRRGEVIVDLLFASSGIEAEVVQRADRVSIAPGVTLPVATVADLMAVKVLARDDRSRPQDWDDLRALLAVASPADLERTEVALRLIQSRGFGRGRQLLRLWRRALTEFRGQGARR